MSTTQLFPPLDKATEAALRASIERFGVLVPVVRNQHGEILDGHHRTRLAAELGVGCPVEVHETEDDWETREIAHTLNADRRHLGVEERRQIVVALRQGGHSQRAIAGALKVDPMTVNRDLKSAGVEAATPDRIEGQDGKSYPAAREPLMNGKAVINANAEVRRVHKALSSIEGFCNGLSGIRVDRVLSVATSDELKAWEKQFEAFMPELARFRRSLKEEA